MVIQQTLKPYYRAVILGGGAAGIAAARRLQEAGITDFILLEARDRLGGRTYTSQNFGDLGAAWSHINDPRLSEKNKQQMEEHERHMIQPLRGQGLTLSFDDQNSEVYLDGTKLSRDTYYDYVREAHDFIGQKLKESGDGPISEELIKEFSRGDRFRELAMRMEYGWAGSGCDVGNNTLAHAYAHFSCASGVLYKEGLGNGIDGLAEPIKPHVALNMRISDIRIKDSPVVRIIAVDAAGQEHEILAQTVISTIPPPVYNHKGDAYEIHHDFPEWKTKAMEALPSGYMNKIIFALDPEFLEKISENTHFEVNVTGLGHMFFIARPGGRNILVGLVGGQTSKDLEVQGTDAAARYALRYLDNTQEFKDIRSHIRAAHYTTWATDPFSRGSFSAPLVGAHDARKQLARQLCGKLFFAGEATACDGWQTHVGGAWLTGLRAAEEALQALGITPPAVTVKAEGASVVPHPAKLPQHPSPAGYRG